METNAVEKRKRRGSHHKKMFRFPEQSVRSSDGCSWVFVYFACAVHWSKLGRTFLQKGGFACLQSCHFYTSLSVYVESVLEIRVETIRDTELEQ